ncbi:MAG: hypothetical protein U0326_15020 [Polyangiales bacterium]
MERDAVVVRREREEPRVDRGVTAADGPAVEGHHAAPVEQVDEHGVGELRLGARLARDEPCGLVVTPDHEQVTVDEHRGPEPLKVLREQRIRVVEHDRVDARHHHAVALSKHRVREQTRRQRAVGAEAIGGLVERGPPPLFEEPSAELILKQRRGVEGAQRVGEARRRREHRGHAEPPEDAAVQFERAEGPARDERAHERVGEVIDGGARGGRRGALRDDAREVRDLDGAFEAHPEARPEARVRGDALEALIREVERGLGPEVEVEDRVVVVFERERRVEREEHLHELRREELRS